MAAGRTGEEVSSVTVPLMPLCVKTNEKSNELHLDA